MVGNLSKYTQYDILRAFFSLQDMQKSHSRKHLAQTLDIGEGTMRTILNALKEKELIASSPSGHGLTEKGEAILKELHTQIEIKKDHIPFIPSRNHLLNYKKTLAHLKNPGALIHVIQLRDTAIKNGAEGCLIFQENEGVHLYGATQPNDYDHDGFNNEFNELRTLFHLHENDLIILTYAQTRRWAEISTLAVAGEIIDFKAFLPFLTGFSK